VGNGSSGSVPNDRERRRERAHERDGVLSDVM
jgi:hypothetical protein